jgi:hypothetical protein
MDCDIVIDCRYRYLKMSGALDMKNFIKKLFRIKEEVSIKSPKIELSLKEQATANKEPWVAVLDTHVNKDNIRNGFFELDWNEYFVLQLREAGYKGDSEEAIVDSWFSELCRNVGNESGVNMDQRTAGYINVNNLGNGKTEVS